MVRKVNIGGEARPIAFTMNCLASFSRETGIGFSGMIDEIPFHASLALIYHGLRDGARLEKVKFDATQEEVGDWIGSNLTLVQELIGYFIEDWAPEIKNVQRPVNSNQGKS